MRKNVFSNNTSILHDKLFSDPRPVTFRFLPFHIGGIRPSLLDDIKAFLNDISKSRTAKTLVGLSNNKKANCVAEEIASTNFNDNTCINTTYSAKYPVFRATPKL